MFQNEKKMFEIRKVSLFLRVKIIETSYSPPTSPQNNVVFMIPNHSVGLKHSPNIVNGGGGK